MIKFSIFLFLNLAILIAAASDDSNETDDFSQNYIDEFIEILNDAKNEQKIRGLYCTEVNITNPNSCKRRFNQLKGKLFEFKKASYRTPSFLNYTETLNNKYSKKSDESKKRAIFQIERNNRDKDNNILSKILPLLLLLGQNDNNEVPPLIPQRQNNLDLSFLQPPTNTQPLSCCANPTLLQPLPLRASIDSSYATITAAVPPIVSLSGKITCPIIQTGICIVPTVINIQTAATTITNLATCIAPANLQALIIAECNGQTECDIGNFIANQLFAVAACITTANSIVNVRTLVQYTCTNPCQIQNFG